MPSFSSTATVSFPRRDPGVKRALTKKSCQGVAQRVHARARFEDNPDVLARILEIESRTRRDPTRVASLDDFALYESPAEGGEALLAQVATNPNVTPYCLDPLTRRMIFVETAPGIQLDEAQFCYQRQFEAASRLISLPYETAFAIAELSDPRFDDLVLIYSVGRCGSTLVSRIWRLVNDTWSLSEPDVFTAIHEMRAQGRVGDDEAGRLLVSAARLVFRPPTQRRRLSLKFRAPCVESSRLMHERFPSAKMLFVYRDAIDCLDSHVRAFGGGPARTAMSSPDVSLAELARLGRMGRPLLAYLARVQCYLNLRRHSVPIAALRYETLVKDPRFSIARMFQHCGVNDASLERACLALDQDALAGTRLARGPDGARTLTVDERDQVQSFLWRYAGMSPDVILEGTLNP
jgi:hypothetical protein